MLAEQRASLANVGLTFEFSAVDGWLSPMGPHLRAACLIGETGKLYMFDVKAAAQATGVVDEHEFSRATNLAESLGHVEWWPQRAAYDVGVIAWIMSFDGSRTLLQIRGDYVGALPDPRVGELVKLIDGWCPMHTR
jgi:hypothetical protein